MQWFKGDAQELKMANAAIPLLLNLSMQKDLFDDDAFASARLGDLISQAERSPLSNAITQAIFRQTFSEIFTAFVSAGTFESYIIVFKKIFGDDVDVTFVVPAPGKLNISIVATGLELSDFVARYIQLNNYVFDNVVTTDGDQIILQTVKGFQSQYELEAMLFELVPAGIFTNISLTLGA